MSSEDTESVGRGRRVHERMIGQFSTDDALKRIFDHARNLGICGVVAYAAAWKFQTPAGDSLVYFDRILGTILAVVAVWLFWINQANGVRYLQARLSRERVLLIGQIYSLVSVTIIASLVVPKFH